jgi:hypothetical protein
MKTPVLVKISLIGIGLLLTASPASADQPLRVLVNPVTKTCDPDVLKVSQKKHGKNVTIFFEIDPAAGPDWRWSTNPDPIVVDNGGGIFSDGKNPGGNGKGQVKLKDRNDNSDVGIFKYTANLINEATATPVAIDPSIENEL